ncbi:hypothetical protein K437DRAFT_258170 [Tilletiaria anomala UBC 951]|uniref:Uncharacterized protein n=1 Tax=Tilletiaria anomala (strain ATCC 24038 / CBS 436.72 / UBC 951) TaxID=1037660 RepID=A0A066VJL8_TILAU|nr:uncharacterized protein K437DRAFT_258170 [Tilletiaria anomala UBC 951]KDN41686.1 hypothetical protein K437DRAFT_258170 [Tilletiaria anomala UBC 951]
MPRLWYIAFQRGPPRYSHAGSSISVSPNITTDLREYQYAPAEDEALQLVYVWVLRLPQEVQAGHACGRWSKVAEAGTSTWGSPQSAFVNIQLRTPSAADLEAALGALHTKVSPKGKGKDRLVELHLAIYAAGLPSARTHGGGAQYAAKRRMAEGDLLNEIAFDLPRAFFASASSSSQTGEESVYFVPVLSTPIEFSITPLSSGDKSERTHDTMRLLRSREHGWLVSVKETAGYELDKHLWDASHLLGSYLSSSLFFSSASSPSQSHRPGWITRLLQIIADESASVLEDGYASQANTAALAGDTHPFVVLELGSGTGCTGISLVAILDALVRTGRLPSERRAEIILTDLESASELLKDNIDFNQSQTSAASNSTQLRSAVLDWTQVSASQTKLRNWKVEHLGEADRQPDLILVSDCTYNQDYFDDLCDVLRTFLAPRRSPAVLALPSNDESKHSAKLAPPSTCLLSKKHRHPDEESLWPKLRARGLRWELLAGENASFEIQSSGEHSHMGLYEITLHPA